MPKKQFSAGAIHRPSCVGAALDASSPRIDGFFDPANRLKTKSHGAFEIQFEKTRDGNQISKKE